MTEPDELPAVFAVKPIVFDFFAGLGGFSAPFIEAGYRAIGFDIEAHDYGNGGYPGELVLRDIRTLTGAELVQTYGVPAVIVASPPCQNYSYFAMPWKRGKQIAAAICGQGEFPAGYKGPRTVVDLNDLFYQYFRIQREVSAAAGHYVPLIVENVLGAQRWVGRSQANFGSFHFWGDVPALMPIPGKVRMKSRVSCAARNFSERVATTPEEAHALHCRLPQSEEGRKLPGNNAPRRWDEREVQRLGDATKTVGHVNKHDGHSHTRHLTNQAESDAVKSGHWFGDGGSYAPMAMMGPKSSARKRASAEIAKIPYPLAAWLAKTFYPKP